MSTQQTLFGDEAFAVGMLQLAAHRIMNDAHAENDEGDGECRGTIES